MIFICPKCGKKIELSVEALIASEYYTVCPQCLSRLQIIGDTAVLADEIDEVKQKRLASTESVVKHDVPVAPEVIETPAVITIPAPKPPVIPQPQQQRYYQTPQYPRQQSQYPSPEPQYYPPQQQPQPYYPNYNPYPPQQVQEKKKYSCTCTGCLVWGLVLMGILFLIMHL